MRISRNDLADAVRQGLLPPAGDDALWAFLASRKQPQIQTGMTWRAAARVVGAAIVIVAALWFLALAYDRWAAPVWALVCAGYVIAFIVLGDTAVRRGAIREAGTVCYLAANILLPYAVMAVLPKAVQEAALGKAIVFGSAIAAGVFLTWWRRRPWLLLVPVALAWIWVVLVREAMVGRAPPGVIPAEIGIIVGVALLVQAYAVDRMLDADYAALLYLGGITYFVGGWGIRLSGSEWQQFAFFLIALASAVLMVLLARRIMAIVGLIGTLVYLVHIAHRFFHDSLFFPVALAALGLLVLMAGTAYRGRANSLDDTVRRIVPPGLRTYLPKAR